VSFATSTWPAGSTVTALGDGSTAKGPSGQRSVPLRGSMMARELAGVWVMVTGMWLVSLLVLASVQQSRNGGGTAEARGCVCTARGTH
jgi:hypothetical protein